MRLFRPLVYLQIPVAIAIHGNKLIETLAFSKVDFPPHQRRHAAVGKRKGPNGVFLHAPASPNIPQSNNEIASAPLMSRRERKNKYTKFSKVQQKDPLEILIAESGRKNQEIVAEQSQYLMTKTIPEPEVEPLPRVEFPDTKGIDPYDPQTFGYIEIGSVIGAHGVHGWLKVRCTTDFPQERLCTAGIRHLKAVNKRAPRRTVLLQGKHRHGDEYLIQLDQIDNRDAAQTLRGGLLYVREEQKDAAVPDQDEYLVSDLVGLDVFLKTGGKGGDDDDDKQFVGIVGGVVFAEDVSSIAGLGHDYLEIILPRGIGGTRSLRDAMVLVPLVPQIVPRVNIKERMILIDPPGGLLDLTYIKEEKTRIRGFLPCAKES